MNAEFERNRGAVRSGRGHLLNLLMPKPADALLELIGVFRDDPRPGKIDVGVGVYRDVHGNTPVLAAVKNAEQRLLEQQSTKGYLGPEGDIKFFELLLPIVFGNVNFSGRLNGVQTPGGTGALRLAAELVALARPSAKVLLGTPTWPNHAPIFVAAGLEVLIHGYFDVATQTLSFDEMITGLEQAEAGDVIVLQGCCHNPTGSDLDAAQWAIVAELVGRRGVVPLIDLAYQGLGVGLEEDARGSRLVVEAAEEALLAYSCDKNFGLYRERTGALFAKSGSRQASAVTQSNLLALARANWSMPPDHGAAIVRTILENPTLEGSWRKELAGMAQRIAAMRRAIVNFDPALAPIGEQLGMFSTLPLTTEQVSILRDEYAVYMAHSGRINLAGLTLETVPSFARAVSAVR